LRIAVLHRYRRALGGVEVYVSASLQLLDRAGHSTLAISEVNAPSGRNLIKYPEGTKSLLVEDLGHLKTLKEVAGWSPDVFVCHGFRDLEFEKQMLSVCRGVFVFHGFNGMCISGRKTVYRPTAEPCKSELSLGCLVKYFPLRCGGSSPISMISGYKYQKSRLSLLATYSGLITHSEFMRRECLKHGLADSKIFDIPFLSVQKPMDLKPKVRELPSGRLSLLFLGRMDRLKGGELMINAVAGVCSSHGKSIELVLIGDGPERARWEGLASACSNREPLFSAKFMGWIDSPSSNESVGGCSLLLVPSVWPEPFGQVGIELGSHGIPAVGFDVGGIGEWLADRQNGILVEASPPLTSEFRDGIIRALDHSIYSSLSAGAIERAKQFDGVLHISSLLNAFSVILGKK
jgi:glycosyltransferase involved in cell wall biosynthesis